MKIRPQIAIAVMTVVLISCTGVNIHTNRARATEQITKVLSPETLKKITSELTDTVEKKDPRSALDSLRRRVTTDDALMRMCHASAHAIGRAAYAKYGFAEAIRFQDEICNSGYQHGVIEAYFTSGEDIQSAIEKACAKKTSGTFLAWECFHGVGHGLMYMSENDLPASIAWCERYAGDFERNSCVNGVMMENFNTDAKRHPSRFLDKDDFFFPCQSQSAAYQADCYLYSRAYYLSVHSGDYTGALGQCASIESRYVGACAEGVGSQAMKENINHPDVAENACASSPKQFRQHCIRGLVGLYIFHFGSLKPAYHLCTTLRSENRATCFESIADTAGLFSRDVSHDFTQP